MNQVYSPETLAERWGCSARHVRDLCKEGALQSFRIGRMLRIRKEALEEFECRKNQPSNGDLHDSQENSASHGTNPSQAENLPDVVIDLAQATRARRKPLARLDMRNTPAR